jgi:AcrR family transcriptional regulator
MRVKTEAKRQHIVDVAAQTFRELGFDGASMAEICNRVGGSKATLYNYFASKDELLFEVMSQSCETEFEAAHSAIDVASDDIGEALQKFGERFLGALYAPEMQANRHLAIASSGKTELGRLMYERGVRRSQALVAELLAAAMQKGKLRTADPEVATRQLYALLEAELIDRFLFQLLGKVSPKEIRALTARAIAVFMAAYSPV